MNVAFQIIHNDSILDSTGNAFLLYIFFSLLRHQIMKEILLQDPQLKGGAVEHNRSGIEKIE
jgi:hypothetical protein